MARNKLWRGTAPLCSACWLAVCLAALLAQPAGAAPPPPPHISARIWGRVESGETAVPALVTLRMGTTEAGGESGDQSRAGRRLRIAELADGFVRDYGPAGLRVRQRYSHLPILAVSLDADALTRLAADPRVVAVTPSRRLHALDAEGDALMNVPAVTSLGYDGSGVGIAVLDSGVDYTHPELAPGGTDASAKTVTLYDAVDPGHPADFQDDYGHGTSVAGIAAGSQTGVARGARIVAVKVLDSKGDGDTEQVLEGVNAVVASVEDGNPYNIRVANLSFGGYDPSSWPPFDGTCDDVAQDFETAFDTLAADGVVVVVSGGNGGCSSGVAFPACISSALAVGAVFDARVCTDPSPSGCLSHSLSYTISDGCQTGCSSDTEADRIACYSDSGSKLDVWAPADCATVPVRGGGTESCFGGTSAAAPYASGVVALLAQALPSASAETLRNTLRDTGTPITDDRNGVTRGRVDALAALSALASCPTPATPLGLSSSSSSPCQGESFELTWNAVTAASSYTVQVASDAAFTTGVLTFTTTQSLLSLSLGGANAYTAYARVRSDSDCGISSPYSASLPIAFRGACDPAGSQTSYVLGIAHGPGVAPSFFYSDLAILNTGSEQVGLTLTFYGASRSRQLTATLAGHQQASWDDVLVTAFGLTGDDGGMIRVDSTGPVQVMARTYSRPTNAPDRSYGQFIAGLTPEGALGAGGVGYFMGLRSDNPFSGSQTFRSNVLFGNVGAVPADVDVRFFSNGGTQIGTVTLRGIAPESQKLVTYALPAGFSASFAEVRVQPSGARIVGIASVVDGTSTDPTTIPLTIP